jgi:DNA-binding SARP family transcriptional activator
VKERFGTNYKMPLLDRTLDTPSRLYAYLGVEGNCSISMVFAAELVWKIRSKDKGHSLRRYLPLVQKTMKNEEQLLERIKDRVRLRPHIHDVTESVVPPVISSSILRSPRCSLPK